MSFLVSHCESLTHESRLTAPKINPSSDIWQKNEGFYVYIAVQSYNWSSSPWLFHPLHTHSLILKNASFSNPSLLEKCWKRLFTLSEWTNHWRMNMHPLLTHTGSALSVPPPPSIHLAPVSTLILISCLPWNGTQPVSELTRIYKDVSDSKSGKKCRHKVSWSISRDVPTHDNQIFSYIFIVIVNLPRRQNNVV